MTAFEISQLIIDQRQSGQSYLEFLRVSALSVGLYNLPAGSADPQQPHTEDEVYYVVSGQGMIRVNTEDRAIEPGTIICVAAGVAHYFHTITADLTVLVFFAPAEGSQKEFNSSGPAAW
jgi:mannose-6-phosphate isomerase-like protein (cupin superfamily)